MATRKKAKSIYDIVTQFMRIRNSGSGNAQLSRRVEQAKDIAQTYLDSIAKTKALKKDREKTNNAVREHGGYSKITTDLEEKRLLRKYVDYNTNKAKAASNG